jgi:hypothetical protein
MSVKIKNAQQSVHPVSAALRGANCLTLGTAALEGGVRTSQAVLYTLSFFWLDGFAVPAPASCFAIPLAPLGDDGASRWATSCKEVKTPEIRGMYV